MDIAWDDVAFFLSVAETGSFSGASRRMRVGQATVSRRIATLEERVGATLFRRGVEGAELTAAGDRLLPAARRMAESAGDFSRMIALEESTPQGLVRIAAPPGVAFDFVAPFAKHVRKTYPDLRLEVLSSIGYVDLARHEADLAIRTKKPMEQDLMWLAEIRSPAIAYARKSYVASLPAKPKLSDVDWITWAPPFDRLPPRPQLEKMIDGFVPVFTSDSYLIQWRAAEAGVGAMFLGPSEHRFARKSLLVPLPFDFDYVGSMYLVCAKTMLLVPRVRAVIDLVLEEFRAVKNVELVTNAALDS